MTYKEIIEMYIDWVLDRDETITQSDVIIACLENGFSYAKISEKVSKRLDERNNL